MKKVNGQHQDERSENTTRQPSNRKRAIDGKKSRHTKYIKHINEQKNNLKKTQKTNKDQRLLNTDVNVIKTETTCLKYSSYVFI